jgi:exopolysaccharide biosynthesis polyprenyl glycosylphosphotransferase
MSQFTHSRNESFRIQAFQFADAILVWVAFWLAGQASDPVRELLGFSVMSESLVDSMNWVLWISVPFTPLALDKFGFYRRSMQKNTYRIIVQLTKVLIVTALVLGVYALFTKQDEARRLVVGLGIAFIFPLIFTRVMLTTAWMSRRTRVDAYKERVVIAGSDGEMAELLAELDPEVTAGWKVVDHFDLRTRRVEELFELLKRESVSRVVFAARETEFERIARAVEACELQGVEAWIAASFIRAQIARPVFDAVGDKPMLVLRSTPELSWELLCKALMDRVGAAVLIALTSPIWVIAYLGIRLKSPGAPVFFSQMRAGRYGKPFRMWKFRTMVANAEELLDKIKEEQGNEMEGPVFKLKNDPRIFPFGALLRKLSIDELPQLLNVVKGDMSLVGPRPLPLYEVEAFWELSHRRRLSVKPGITCEWQAGGRNKISSFEEWVAMDLKYIDNWSLWLDIKILIRTIPAVLFGTGAN